MTNKTTYRPKCERCGRHFLQYRQDGSYFCRQCGHDSRKAKQAPDGT